MISVKSKETSEKLTTHLPSNVHKYKPSLVSFPQISRAPTISNSMAQSKPDPVHAQPASPYYYTPLPPTNYIVWPLYQPRPSASSRCRLICAAALILAGVLIYLFWPTDPTLKIARLRLDRIKIHTVPVIAVDISLFLTVRVHNTDVYSMDYSSIDVTVGYRGRALGHVRSDHGHVRARGSSYVDAQLQVDGVEVLYDVAYLLKDLAKGMVPLETVTEVSGRLGLLFFELPFQAKVPCEVLVNPRNQTIMHQNCFPEDDAFRKLQDMNSVLHLYDCI